MRWRLFWKYVRTSRKALAASELCRESFPLNQACQGREKIAAQQARQRAEDPVFKGIECVHVGVSVVLCDDGLDDVCLQDDTETGGKIELRFLSAG